VWSIRTARPADHQFLFELHRATMRDYVEQVWGWDEAEQEAFFLRRFEPDRWQILEVDGEDVGVLIVDEADDEILLSELQILPGWQGRGLGTSIVRSLMERAASAGKPLILRVLHVNPRAKALYARLGFQPFEEIETHTYMRWVEGR
jgi:GNAT superfamily N-acetyltransferase